VQDGTLTHGGEGERKLRRKYEKKRRRYKSEKIWRGRKRRKYKREKTEDDEQYMREGGRKAPGHGSKRQASSRHSVHSDRGGNPNVPDVTLPSAVLQNRHCVAGSIGLAI
jgi:hypothetical protein